jgi:hypothetical protein
MLALSAASLSPNQNARVYALGCVAAMRTSVPPEDDLYQRARA